MVNRTNVLIATLVLVIVVLAGILIYQFVVQPKISGYDVQRQSEGVEAAILTIMQRAATCQAVPLTYNNQTITLIAIECLQQGQPAQ